MEQIIINTVEDFHDLKRGELYETRKSKKQPNCFYRQQAMWLINKYLKLTSTEIGIEFDKDRATAIHAVKVVNDALETDKKFSFELTALKTKVETALKIKKEVSYECLLFKDTKLIKSEIFTNLQIIEAIDFDRAMIKTVKG